MTDSELPPPEPLKTDDLDMAALPPGRISRLLVELVHDRLGRPVHLPVLVARGRHPGPTFGITAVVHGNELNGIPVIHRLFSRLETRSLHGNLVAVAVVNVPGYLAAQRAFNDGIDINTIMPGRADGRSSEVYVHRFIDKIVRRFDYLVDLHTASFGRVNSLYVRADMTDEVTAKMACLQRPQVILHNQPSDGTLRGAAQDLGIPAITLEIGNPLMFQPEYINRSLVGLRAVLAEAGMITRRAIARKTPPVLCCRSEWMHADHGGLLEVFPDITDRVERGQMVAQLRSIFGDVLREYPAPADGIVIGKDTNPLVQTGSRMVHLGILARPGEYPFVDL